MPNFGSLRSFEQLDALAQRYHCRPSRIVRERDPYRAYCIDEACAIAGEAKDARLIEQLQSADPPALARPKAPHWHGDLLVGTFPVIRD